jgi:hypothetical protein
MGVKRGASLIRGGRRAAPVVSTTRMALGGRAGGEARLTTHSLLISISYCWIRGKAPTVYDEATDLGDLQQHNSRAPVSVKGRALFVGLRARQRDRIGRDIGGGN